MKKTPQRFNKNDFVTSQKAERFCSKCKQVPYSPQRSACCNLLYCDVCSPKITKCPKCKESTLPFKKDQDLYSKITKLKIWCPNKTRGCTWKGEMYKLKTHLEIPECTAIKGSMLIHITGINLGRKLSQIGYQ